MSQLSQVVMELGPEPGHPFGNRDHVYHLYLPLRPDGAVNMEALASGQRTGRFRRFRPGRHAALGRIVVTPQGQLALENETDGSAGRLGLGALPGPFVVGRTVPVAEGEDGAHPFQVIAIRPA